MRGVSAYGRKIIAAGALVLIASTGNGLAGVKDRNDTPTVAQRVHAWLTKRVPAAIAALGEKLTIPGG